LDNNHSILKNIARTSMESKIVSVDSDALSDLAVEAILAISATVSHLDGSDDIGFAVVDLDNVKIQKKPGGSMSDSRLIRGMIIDKEITRSEMPRTVKDAKILLLNTALEIEKTEFDAKITIEKPGQMQM